MTRRPNESARPEVETTTSPDAQRSPHRITRKKEQRSRIPRGVALVNTHTRPNKGEDLVRASNGCLTNHGEEDMGRRRGQEVWRLTKLLIAILAAHAYFRMFCAPLVRFPDTSK